MIKYRVTFIFYFKNHGHPTYCQGHGANFLISVCIPLRPYMTQAEVYSK